LDADLWVLPAGRAGAARFVTTFVGAECGGKNPLKPPSPPPHKGHSYSASPLPLAYYAL
jgi:hypothetical protein